MTSPAELDVLSITTTVPSAEAACKLARELVGRRLVACVQVEPGLQSFYRWNGELCEEAEVRLTLKTPPGLEARLLDFLMEHHPYTLPQFLVARLQASPEYARWVRQEVAADPPLAG